MKTVLAAILAFSTLGALSSLIAADGEADRLQQGTPAKRLAAVTWDPQAGKLEWVVQSGFERNGEFTPSPGQEAHYEITPEQARMAFQGQQRGFTQQEASWLQGLLHVLTVYCAESTVWWEQGQGTPQDKGSPVQQSPSDEDLSPHKVVQPLPRKTPGAVQLVAIRAIQ